MYLPHVITEKSISVYLNGVMKPVAFDHPKYNEIREALLSGNHDIVPDIIDVVRAVSVFSNGKITVQNGSIYYGDYLIDNSLTTRILQIMNDGYNSDPLVRFLENLLENPDTDAIKELYDFLSNNNMPITEDGHFLAFKKVNMNYTSIHDSKTMNTIGTFVEMPRFLVQKDRKVTCSSGLHFCSQEYLPLFGNGGTNRVLVVKVNPRDVVSIPIDYKNAKGRACKYFILEEVNVNNIIKNNKTYESHFENKAVYTPPEPYDNITYDDKYDDEYNTDDDYYKHERSVDEYDTNYSTNDDDSASIVTYGYTDSNDVPTDSEDESQDVDIHVTTDSGRSYVRDELLTRAQAASKLCITRNALSKRISRGSLTLEYVNGLELVYVPAAKIT